MKRKRSTAQITEIGSTNSAYTAAGTADSHGPMYGITSMNAVQSPKSNAYSAAPSTRPVRPRIHMPTRALEARHVEEHVDRDDDDEDHREQEQHDREGRPSRDRDGVLHVSRDVASAEGIDPVIHLLADLDSLEA